MYSYQNTENSQNKHQILNRIVKSIENQVKYSDVDNYFWKLIKKQDKNYKKRYDFSTLNNAKRITYTGINRIMLEDKINWECESCGGIISIQEHSCSDCGLKKENNP